MEKTSLLKLLLQKQKQCTGCAACANVCPMDAISMQADRWGFLYPEIAPSVCVDCHRCAKICPVLNQAQSERPVPGLCYAVQAQDPIRMMSSSGGAFGIFAEQILNDNGVVYGASMDGELNVSHIAVSSIDSLHKIQKSKYVQSSVGFVYRDVQEKLNEGKTVLFTGTPCQVAGLRAYLEKSYGNLLTIDILCHGVPSQKMLHDSMQGGIDGKKVISIDFRDKRYGWECLALTATLEDHSERRISYNESRYEQGFHPNMTLRESCYSCQFCSFPRQGDITIGDFWSIAESDPSMADQKGTSVVILNTDNGKSFFDCASRRFAKCKPFPIDCLRNNRIQPDILKDGGRKYFLDLYPRHSFNRSVYLAQQGKFDIGIVGNWSYPNYGTALTYYTLFVTLKRMGYAVAMVSWPKTAAWKPYEKAELFQTNPYKSYEVLPIPDTRDTLLDQGEICDTYVLGSDQLLNNNLYHSFERFVQLDWVPSYKRKIAYATSFGCDYIWGEQKDHAEMAHFLRQFDAVSVREKSAVQIMKEQYGVTADVVLDPVFLSTDIVWKLATKGTHRVPKEKYLFAYFLDPTREEGETLKKCCKKMSLKPHSVIDAAPEAHTLHSTWGIDSEYNVKLEEWLAYIQNAEVVITDSFHGMCVAILFNKKFIAIANYSRGAARFTELLSKLGLESRLLYSINELSSKMDILNEEIPYDSVNQILEIEKKRCVEWLIKALQDRRECKALSNYDIISRQMRQYNSAQNETNAKQWQQLEDHRLRLDGVDATLSTLRERLGSLDQISGTQNETNAKQWQQLEDHRLRLDGIDAALTSHVERVETLEHGNALLHEVSEKQRWQLTEMKKIIDLQQQKIDILTQQNTESFAKLQKNLDSTNERLSLLVRKSIRLRISNFLKKISGRCREME